MITFKHEISPIEANYKILTLAKDYKIAHPDKTDKMPEPDTEIKLIWNDGEPTSKRTHKDDKMPFRIDGLAALYRDYHAREGMQLEVSYDPDKMELYIITKTENDGSVTMEG